MVRKSGPYWKNRMQDPTPFWQPAIKRAEIWRTILGFALIGVTTLVLAIGIFIGAVTMIGGSANFDTFITTPSGMAMFFLTFAAYHVALMALVPLVHRRGYRSLFGPTYRLNPRQYLYGMLAIVGIMAAAMVLEFFVEILLPTEWLPTYRFNPFDPWVYWLVPFIVLIFVQTLAEEVLFRGYLLQQLRARFTSPLIWAVLPSLIFGALHYDAATFGVNTWAYIANTTFVGVIASYVTIRTGNLGAAAGLHFMNNLMLLFFGNEGNLDAVSLVVINMDLKGAYMTYSLLSQTVLEVFGFIWWWRWMDRRDATRLTHA